MVIVIGTDGIRLEDPNDFKGFKVQVATGAEEDLGDVGTFAGGDAWIHIDAVRRLAGEHADDAWEAGFEAMLEYARSKGWVDDAAGTIQAHVESTGP